MTSHERAKVRFPSDDTTCAAWHYPGTNGGCVIMAGGTGVTKEPATDRFAPRFQQAGFSVLAIDFRRLGESGGEPRQIVRVREQLADSRRPSRLPGRCPRWIRRAWRSGDSRWRAATCSRRGRRRRRPGGSDRAGTACRRAGRRAERDALHDAAGGAAPQRACRARRAWSARRPRAAAGAARWAARHRRHR